MSSALAVWLCGILEPTFVESTDEPAFPHRQLHTIVRILFAASPLMPADKGCEYIIRNLGGLHMRYNFSVENIAICVGSYAWTTHGVPETIHAGVRWICLRAVVQLQAGNWRGHP